MILGFMCFSELCIKLRFECYFKYLDLKLEFVMFLDTGDDVCFKALNKKIS